MSKPALQELEALRKQYKDQKEKKETNQKRGIGDFYPFWSIENDAIATIRSLPIANQKGALPFLEKDHHKISIDGKDETIPCEAMYGNPCPICELSRDYYNLAKKYEKANDPAKKAEFEALGKYYYRSRSYLGSVLVKKDPLPKDDNGENYEGKVKVVQFGNQLYKKFNTSLETLVSTNEIDDVPWSLENGLDFNIVKKMSTSGYAEWDLASDFARRASSLPTEFIETFTPVDLKKFLPASFGQEKVQRMLEAHLNNGSVEHSDPADDSSNSVEQPVSTPVEAHNEHPVVEHQPEPPVSTSTITKKVEATANSDDDIEAMLRQLRTKPQ
jgi:hypothetical protein